MPSGQIAERPDCREARQIAERPGYGMVDWSVDRIFGRMLGRMFDGFLRKIFDGILSRRYGGLTGRRFGGMLREWLLEGSKGYLRRPREAVRPPMVGSLMRRPSWASMRRPMSEAPKAEHKCCISAEDHQIVIIQRHLRAAGR